MTNLIESEQLPTCKQAGCDGISLAAARWCWAHASEEEIAAALKLVGETGEIDAWGVSITSALLEQILTAAPRGKNEEPLIKACRFTRATFVGDATFHGVAFVGDADFSGAIFTDGAWFGEATFTGEAEFSRARFKRDAWFGEATFKRSADFLGATFTGDASFERATFAGDAFFATAKFKHEARFERAAFKRRVAFSEATFTGDADFSTVTFTGDARFGEVTFKRRAEFGGARFEQARQFGPLWAYQWLGLDDVQFAQPVQIEASSPAVCCRRARFPGGAQFRLRYACVVLDDTDFGAPSILVGIPSLSREALARLNEQIAETLQQEPLADIWQQVQPKLVSLRRANVAGLVLSNVSAADCRFAGAHNLDQLRLESGVSFATAPPPMGLGERRWGGREVIAEERAWRADPDRPRRFRRGWTVPVWPGWLDDQEPGVLDPGQIAGLYRALRKGREDIKDEPGAADFYYGEMEMRRARPGSGSSSGGQPGAATRGRVERGIVAAYWLVSGYGLRAWRAVAGLAVVTALLAVAFHLVGFAVPPQPVSYWTSLLYAFRATLSLTDDDVKLTAWGQLLQGVLRLTGPVLLGLALLALRGRVRR